MIGMQVDEKVLEFIGKLREAGLAISISESMDALRGLAAVPVPGVPVLRAALKTTLVKNENDFPVFDSVFDTYFTGSEDARDGYPEDDRDGVEWADLSRESLATMLEDAVASGGEDDLAAAAGMVAAVMGDASGSYRGGGKAVAAMAGTGYYMFRAMEMIEFNDVRQRLQEMTEAKEIMPEMPVFLAQEEIGRRLDRFKELLEREISRRLSIERGTPPKRNRKRPQRPEEVDFTGASLKQIEEMRKILPSLARKLAARLARKHGAGKHGRVDIRSTLRHSLSTGGVPIEVKHRRKVPSKPELFILCDISGSVRTFSTFTLQLVYSLHQQFKSVRSFAFIDRIDEVTDCFQETDVGDAVDRAYREADVVEGDGHSDIGRALTLFYDEFHTELSQKSTVLVLSDARNNLKDPRAGSLGSIEEQSRRVYWLNPEPCERWNTGDSVMDEYRRFCSVHECRNLKQLAEFVYRGA